MIAALSCSRPQPGAPGRPDVAEIIALLLSFGADPDQRGINDYTALHMAVGEENLPRSSCFSRPGADPRLRTRIDYCESPREIAEARAFHQMSRLLAAQEARLEGRS